MEKHNTAVKVGIVVALTVVAITKPEIIAMFMAVAILLCVACPLLPILLVCFLSGWFDDEDDDE
jgi:hypothetical protein